MQQLIHLMSKVQLAPGVAVGLMVSAASGLGQAGLNLTVTAGIARVGTLQDDAALTNKAAYGMNQPGRVIEVSADATVAMTDAVTRLLWLKTDGTFVLTLDATDPNDVAPELGPNPFRGEMLALGQQEGPLRRREAASVLLAKVTAAAGAITVVNNTVRAQVLI